MSEFFRETGRPVAGTSVNTNTSASGYDGSLIDSPGVGKEIVIMGLSLNSGTGSLGTGTAGASSFWYANSGMVSFTLGIAVGEDKPVTTNLTSGYLSVHYYIRSIQYEKTQIYYNF